MKHLILTFSLCAAAGMAQTQSAGQQQPAAQPKAIPPDTVVMKVGGQPMTAAEVNRLVTSFAQDVQRQAVRDPKTVFQSYFMMRTLAEQAIKEKLDENDLVKRQIELMKSQVLASAVINRYGASIQVSDEEARARYEAEKSEKFQQAKIRSILLKCQGPGTVANALNMADPTAPKADKAPALPTESEARVKADDIVKKARGGADFAALAKQFSDDKTTAAGGGLYPAVRQADRIPEEIKKIVFSLKDGEVSEPVMQPLGLYVIRMEERGFMPFEDAKPHVTAEITQERFSQWMDETRKPFEVTIENPEFFGMSTTPGQPPSKQTPAPSAK
ncbi:MAG: peptidylprolyl isomerase [Acidobacteria bacterium]|nr:peptidylprolyl isomerase [Acidobacteriota bacterium]